MPEAAEGGTGESTTGLGGLSVPLGVHIAELRVADKELAAERDLRYCERNKRQDDALSHLQNLHEAMRRSDQPAIEKALDAQQEMAKAHNDLLRKMEKLVETFPPRAEVSTRFERVESWQARLTGGLLLIAAIGVTNLVKIWS